MSSRKQKWRSSNPNDDDDDGDNDRPDGDGSPISLTIETLTGTAFEITVSPVDYVSSLKARIQRVEGAYQSRPHDKNSVLFFFIITFCCSSGIPVSQQHLLVGEKILSDNTTIANNNLRDGATLRLVLSLQGGPIGTSRRMLPLDNDTIRQLVNLNKSVIFSILFVSKNVEKSVSIMYKCMCLFFFREN